MSIIIEGLEHYKKSINKSICIGTFDGFHKGHQTLTKNAEFLLTFNPHPKNILTNKLVPRLTTTEEQKWFFSKQIVIKFNNDIAKMKAKDFLNNVISPFFSPKEITVGYDFKFGVKGSGNIDLLSKWGKENNCKITIINEQVDSQNIPYKSSLIRNELQSDPNTAFNRLGHPYLIIGTVIDGEKRGRKIGFPTANLHVDKNKCIPKFGVYKSHVIIDKKKLNSITYIGRKPSFDGNHPSIETHILNNFNQNIYNKKVFLFLEQFLRDEQKFNNQDDLINQIKSDIKSCI